MQKQKFGFFVLFLCLILVCPFYGGQDKDETIPVTTKSEKAKKLYMKGQEAASDVDIPKIFELLNQAIQEDPTFFRALYDLSMYNLFNNNQEGFKKYAEQALKSDLKLSAGEMLLFNALEKLHQNMKADVTDIGKQLVDMYPKDENVYYQSSMYYMIQENYEHAAATLKKALDITKKPAPIYNMLGYNYMYQKDFPAAEKAFTKYLELEPDLPNPYDSFGDYYMAVKEYKKAYKYFMKAYEMDNKWTFSRDKALKAKELMEKE